MIFSWANKQLEKLSETMAPLSNLATGKFIQALQNNDVQTAKALLSTNGNSNQGFNQQGSNGYHLNDGFNSSYNGNGTNIGEPQMTLIDPHSTSFHPHKQTKAIHITCQYSNTLVYNYILSTFYSNDPAQVLLQTDAAGNTVLHYACLSTSHNAFSFVQFLIEAYKSYSVQHGISQKNNSGETAYDVARNDMIRQYLLPIQLQFETQECLNNGGVGLPQGIDLGGLKIQNRNLAPPPTMGGVGAGAGAGAVMGGGGPPPMNGAGGSNMYSMNSTPMSRYAIPNELKMSSTSPSVAPTPTTYNQLAATVSPSPYNMNQFSTFNLSPTKGVVDVPSNSSLPKSTTITQVTNPTAFTVSTNNDQCEEKVLVSGENNAVTTSSTTGDITSTSNTVSNEQTKTSSLPHGWVELMDQSSSRPYYYNQELNLTQWDEPADATKNDERKEVDSVLHESKEESSKNVAENRVEGIESSTGTDDAPKEDESILNDLQTLNVSDEKEAERSLVEEDTKSDDVVTDESNADNTAQQSDGVLSSNDFATNPVEEKYVSKNEKENILESEEPKQAEPSLLASSADTNVKQKDQTEENMKLQQNELPAGWSELYDESSGRSYFYNEKTNVTQWDKPDSQTTTSIPANNPSSSVQSDLLPEGWTVLQDPTSGRPYYYNQQLNLTQWEKPSSTPISSVTKIKRKENTSKKLSKEQNANNGSSSTYARRGYSTAAVLPSNSKYKPDGFHSSSSDKRLQQKYGHDASITGPPSGNYNTHSNIAPPPSSAGSNSGNLSLGQNPYSRANPMARGHCLNNNMNNGTYVAYSGMSYQSPQVSNTGYNTASNYQVNASTGTNYPVEQYSTQNSYGSYDQQQNQTNYTQGSSSQWATSGYQQNQEPVTQNIQPNFQTQQNELSASNAVSAIASVTQSEDNLSHQDGNVGKPGNTSSLSTADLFGSSPQQRTEPGLTADSNSVDDTSNANKVEESNDSNIAEKTINIVATAPTSASQLFNSNTLATTEPTTTQSEQNENEEASNFGSSIGEVKKTVPLLESNQGSGQQYPASSLFGHSSNSSLSKKVGNGNDDILPHPTMMSEESTNDLVTHESDDVLSPPPMMTEDFSNGIDSGNTLPPPPDMNYEGDNIIKDGQPEQCTPSENDDDDLLPPPPMIDVSLDQ